MRKESVKKKSNINCDIMKLKLKTLKGTAFHQKTDIFRRIMWFTYMGEHDNFIPVSVDDVKRIVELNKNGERDNLSVYQKKQSQNHTLCNGFIFFS